jgi:hypothetical protein
MDGHHELTENSGGLDCSFWRLPCLFRPRAPPPYLDPSLPIETRIADLISRMTLEEKDAELKHLSSRNDILHIPAWGWWNQTLHGVWSRQPTTVFPTAPQCRRRGTLCSPRQALMRWQTRCALHTTSAAVDRDPSTDLSSAWICPPGSPLEPVVRNPSLRSLLHEPIFMMQAAEYGSLHNPVSGRADCAGARWAGLVRYGLRQPGTRLAGALVSQNDLRDDCAPRGIPYGSGNLAGQALSA